jgi:hypothetical protein
VSGAVTACASCGAPVVWCVIHDVGARLPVDVNPSSKGTLYVIDAAPGRSEDLLVFEPSDPSPYVAQAKARGDRLYVSHFATCPATEKN